MCQILLWGQGYRDEQRLGSGPVKRRRAAGTQWCAAFASDGVRMCLGEHGEC